ncbi:DUF4352 domain-containing protein [Nocardia farcinica]|uniref:DUF4352 domain-containing protein n=1 Tax=Nocardia farcinica TaxID=37329 RepID=UPI001893000C|nr:DUF4352 domain-containing protein [Nocardia farcinica]MBF6292213.1 DUF4352 domain-containing protein [Nocardia farcinica]MBF6377175.1 DUF4352 domain-containing protein [Nocardia farcinica]
MIALTAICLWGTGCGGTATGGDSGPEELPIPARSTLPVRDGALEFVVTRVEFGATHLGGPVTGADATGRFAVARVEVTNTGDEPVTFDYAHQQLIDSRGAAHTPDLPGSMSLNGEFRHDYNPGVGTTLQLAFDLPADTTPATLVLRAAPASPGAAIALR